MSRIEFLLKYLKPGIILDIGNLGRAKLFHERLIKEFPQSEIHGIDIEDQAQYGLHFPHQMVGNAEHMPYQDNFFDSVYMGEVIEHSWVPKQIIDECYRVLKRGGVLILDCPNVYALSRMARFLFTGRDVILGSPNHRIFYSRAMMENMLAMSGFQQVITLADRKCTIKSRSFTLPRFGSFKYLGEHLLAAAWK
ncbi:MAG: methyltransferase domain-containing protein [Patescibacteria group bacterium]